VKKSCVLNEWNRSFNCCDQVIGQTEFIYGMRDMERKSMLHVLDGIKLGEDFGRGISIHMSIT